MAENELAKSILRSPHTNPGAFLRTRTLFSCTNLLPKFTLAVNGIYTVCRCSYAEGTRFKIVSSKAHKPKILSSEDDEENDAAKNIQSAV